VELADVVEEKIELILWRSSSCGMKDSSEKGLSISIPEEKGGLRRQEGERSILFSKQAKR